MSGICGWIGGAFKDDAARERLTLMAGGLACDSQSNAFARVASGLGLAVIGTKHTVDLHADDGPVIAGFEGYPAFDDAELAAVASRCGAAAAIAQGFVRYRRDLPKMVKGQCSFTVLDSSRRQALVAIDRMATRAMCFTEHESGVVAFGTTVETMLPWLGDSRQIDPQTLFDYIYFSRVPAPSAIWRGIRKLLPAQYLWVESGRSEVGRYWSMPYGTADGAVPFEVRAAELRRILESATENMLRDEEQNSVGAFLSGGVDSSTVVGLLAERRGRQAPAFSIGFDAEGYDETGFAAASARHFHVPHHVYDVTPDDVTDAIPAIAQAYDEPFGNPSAVPVYHCARVAREHGVELLLAGDGGDEIFGGNARYAEQKIFEAYGFVPEWLRRGIVEPAITMFPVGSKIYPVRKAQAYLRKARTPLPERLELDNPLRRRDPASVLDPEIAHAIDVDHPVSIMREAYESCRAPETTYRMMALDQQITLADDDLRKVSRMCELAGVRVKFPLLDEELVEFSARVPVELLVRGFTLRYFFKKAMAGMLPESTLRKKKHGFGLPFGIWLERHRRLQDVVDGSLTVLLEKRLVRRDFLDEIRRAHAEVHSGFYGLTIWVLVMLGAWFSQKGDSRPQLLGHCPAAVAVRARLRADGHRPSAVFDSESSSE